MDSDNEDDSDPLSNGGGGSTGSKRGRQELGSFSAVIASKSKPCTKFFSNSGCPFGEGCYFLHHVPGRLSAVTQMTNLGNPSSRNSVGVSGLSNHGVKTRMCNKVNTEEGCRFGDKCRFVHGERELGRSSVHGPEHYSPMGGRLSPGGGRFDHAPPGNPSSRTSVGVSGLSDHGVKIRMCNKVNTEEGCRFGDNCRFAHSERELGWSFVHGPVHYSPMGGHLSAGGGRSDQAPGNPSSRNSVGVSGLSDHGVKIRMCNKVNTEEGCRFGDKCRFSLSESELGRSSVHGPEHHSPMGGRLSPGGGRFDHAPPGNPSSRTSVGVSGLSDHGVKIRMCNKVNTEEGCRFGDNCRFAHSERELGWSFVHGPVHYSPMGGHLSAGGGRFDHAPGNPSSRNSVGVSGLSDHCVKIRMCNNVNTEEGRRFGDKCRFSHSERELGRSSVLGPVHYSPMGGRLSSGGRRFDHAPPGLGASFGASASAKISVDASLAGVIIGVGGINIKTICQVTGAWLSIRDHESDPNLKNVELKGTFDQIKDATSMVRGLIINGPSHITAGLHRYLTGGATASPANNLKSKLCDNFVKGSCTFGDRCHFAHGAS